MNFTEEWKSIEFSKIVDLYNSVHWTIYSDNPEKLKTALENSTYVLIALENDQVIGLLRSVSDEISIHYLQDILIHPNFQRKGIGRNLFDKALERFKNVRTHMLLTDDEKKQKLFYQSLGYKNTKDLKDIVLNAYVKMNGVDLK